MTQTLQIKGTVLIPEQLTHVIVGMRQQMVQMPDIVIFMDSGLVQFQYAHKVSINVIIVEVISLTIVVDDQYVNKRCV